LNITRLGRRPPRSKSAAPRMRSLGRLRRRRPAGRAAFSRP